MMCVICFEAAKYEVIAGCQKRGMLSGHAQSVCGYAFSLQQFQNSFLTLSTASLEAIATKKVPDIPWCVGKGLCLLTHR
jgi:hypothetical protein